MRNFYLIPVLLISLSCGNDTEKLTVERKDLVESVYTSLTVQPENLYDAYSAVNGLIGEIFVDEGDHVKKGDPLIQIINNAPKLNAENARLSLQLARENYSGGAAILAGIQDEIVAAVLNFKNDSVNYFRQKNLWDQKIGSKADYDAAELRYQLSSNQLNLLKSRYERTKIELETAVQQARNSYEVSLVNTADFTVKSMIDGKVYSIPGNVGELVSSIQSLAKIGSSTSFIMELLVDEVDIVKISAGQRVLISLDAYKGEVFEGRISKIYPNKDLRNQTFLVEAVFDDPPPTLYPGLSGEANIITDIRENVLVIPRDYLVEGNMVKTSEGLNEVEPGVSNLDEVEILSGISEGTVIYKPD